MLILSLFQVTALNNTKKKSKDNLTLHHMGKIFSSQFIVIKFIIWRVTFLSSFLLLKILGWTYGFRTVYDLPRAHWDETDFSYTCKVEWNYIYLFIYLFESSHEKMCLMSYASSKGSDQTARMRRLICAFAVRIWHKTHFLMVWLNYILIYLHTKFVSFDSLVDEM